MSRYNVSVPLIASSSRKRVGFLRNIRRRLRTYLIILAILIILFITIAHKELISYNNNQQLINTNQDPNHVDKTPNIRRGKNYLNSKHPKAVRPIKVVSAKYVGPQPWWANGEFNLTVDELNENNYNPVLDEGKNGRPVYLLNLSKEKIDRSFSINKFNLIASDRISVDRTLPDPRKPKCRSIKFDEKLAYLPDTSIIIVYHNEAWSTLVRTVHSIINNSPHKLLKEIILVDDASERKFLEQDLDNYMRNLEETRGVSIKILRSKERIGLVRARLMGVAKSEGTTLTFIDAHCEATKGWLEPLMEVIKNDNKTAAVPIIDTISDQTFAYKRTFDLYIGAFNWGLNFRWYPVSLDEVKRSNNASEMHNNTNINQTYDKTSQDLVAPFNTPAMAGGLFSIDKDFFTSIGSYDQHMDIWGAENIEISLRIWQCGGQIKAVPCSHVAHLFRKSSPYAGRSQWNVDEIFNFNRVRLIEVWLDEWKNFVYDINPPLKVALSKMVGLKKLEGIEDRKKLRNHLKCKPFGWYLDNVWPENFFPTEARFFGKIKHRKTDKCLERLPSQVLGLRVQTCVQGIDQIQSFVFDYKTRFIMSNDNNCLDAGSNQKEGTNGFFTACINHDRQRWNVTKDGQIKNELSGLCLQYFETIDKVQLEKCNENQPNWYLVSDKEFIHQK